MTQQWEYQIEEWAESTHDVEALERGLNSLGSTGWELAGVMEVGKQPHRQYRMIFKRLVEAQE